MITGIILYFIIAISLVPIFTRLEKYKNHKGILIPLFIVIILLVAIITPVLPLMSSIKNVISDAELIHNYDDSIGTLYYDLHTNTYFIAKLNEWKIINMYERVNIDYELGKNIHDATRLIDASEYILNSMIK